MAGEIPEAASDQTIETDASPQAEETAVESAEIDAPEIAGRIGDEADSKGESEAGEPAAPAAEGNAFDKLYGELFPEEKVPAAKQDDEDPLARRRQADRTAAEPAGEFDAALQKAEAQYGADDPLLNLTKAMAAKLKASEAKDQERTQQFTQAEQRAFIASERAAAMPLIDGLKMPEIFGTTDSRNPRQQRVAEFVADRMSAAAGALRSIFGEKYPGNAFVAKLVAGVVTGKAMPDPKAAAIKEVRETVRRRSAAAGVPASAGKEKPFKITGIEDARTATLNSFDRKYPGVS